METLSTHKYVYRMTKLRDYDELGNDVGEKWVYSIGIRDEIGMEYPHPITDFIRLFRSSSMSLERERQVASTVCQFLNFVLTMNQINDGDFLNLKFEGIFGLNFIHGSRFLQYADNRRNNKGIRVKKSTVDRKERVLTDLYVFLHRQGIINKDLNFAQHNENGKLQYLSPFTRTRGRSNDIVKKDLRDFGENRQQLLVELIETALSLQEGKPIAFGIALQCLGGLRRGEVVNLTTGSYWYEGRGNNLIVDIKNRQHYLFPHKKNTKKEGVKKTRIQDVLPSAFLDHLLQTHKNFLKNKKKKSGFMIEDALFVNRTGYPMSGKSYEERFERVVNVFLKRLMAQGRFEEHAYLTSKPLNTHTLRGVFTNICLDDLGMNVRQTANARGDKWDTSVMSYVEELTGKQKMAKATEQLAKAVVNAHASNSLLSKWDSEVI